MNKDNSKIYLLVLLGLLTAFGPFVTDMYLPTLPAMTDFFHTSSSMVQMGLTTSMIGLAAGQLLFGPLSDKYGRRTPLLTAMWLFIGSTLLCTFASDIRQFVTARFLQGIAGSGGIVISRSVATDRFGGRDLARMLALIGAVNGVARKPSRMQLARPSPIQTAANSRKQKLRLRNSSERDSVNKIMRES